MPQPNGRRSSATSCRASYTPTPARRSAGVPESTTGEPRRGVPLGEGGGASREGVGCGGCWAGWSLRRVTSWRRILGCVGGVGCSRHTGGCTGARLGFGACWAAAAAAACAWRMPAISCGCRLPAARSVGPAATHCCCPVSLSLRSLSAHVAGADGHRSCWARCPGGVYTCVCWLCVVPLWCEAGWGGV